MNESQFKSHALWSELQTVATVLEEIDKTGDAEATRTIDEFRELLAITASIEEGEWTLITETMLTQIQTSWNQVSANLATYPTTLQLAYLSQALPYADTLRSQLAAMPRSVAHGTAQANVTKAFNRYRDDLDKSRERILERLDEALAQAGARESALKAEAATLAAELTATQASVVALEERIAQGETRLDAALTANNETFNAGQTTRDGEFKTWLDEREKGFAKLAAPHLTAITAADADAREHLSVISGLRTSTVEMSHLAAGDILADQYGEYAKSERRASYIAYAIGVLAALGSILIILLAFGTIDSELAWQNVTLKLALTAAAGGLAAVAFRFGGQAVRRATSFKRQELELRALQPFLKDVDGADLAKTTFLERAFGRAWEDPGASKGDADVNESLVKLVATLVQAIPKSGA